MGVSTATTKRLFAVSGNRCAFPGCTDTLVTNGIVTGEICHVKAQSADGPRYDHNQTDEERHRFDNLVLMCGTHHKVIDTDVRSYTVARLTEIKTEHEATHASGAAATDEIASQLVANISTTAIGGSNIVSINQMGGQVAHTITNVGAQPRVISPAAAQALATALRSLPPANVEVRALMTDAESAQFGKQLTAILRAGGWSVHETTFVPHTAIAGVVICVHERTLALDTLNGTLRQLGFRAVGELQTEPIKTFAQKTVDAIVIVGSNLP